MSSGESDSESNRSVSPVNNGPAPTPGHGLERSPSNSPEYNPKNGGNRVSRSRSGSRDSHSRSQSPESNKSGTSRRSRSPGSNQSSRSSSPGSKRSGSAASNKSGGTNRSRSGTPVSNRSRSKSVTSNRSRSRSKSKDSNRSRSKSVTSNRSRSRSKSPTSIRSRSRSKSGASNRSRSGSAASKKSRSKSVESNRSKASRSRSGSAASKRSRSKSGSRSRTPSADRGNHSGSNSPNLQIDEPGTPVDQQSNKRRRSSSDNEEERVASTKKKKQIIDSDSEGGGEDKEGKEVSAAAIFGDDADDISSEEEKETEKKDKEEKLRKSDDEGDHYHISGDEDVERVGDDDDKENEPEPIPETRIDVEVPKISCDLGRDIHFVKLPNFLSVETRPFDPETYEDEIDEEETLDEEGRARLKLKVENTIRWRDQMDKEGNMTKESNARLVRWSDGSYSLHLGSEIFDVYKQPLQGDHNHLFIRQGTGLQGQAVFRTKLSFRPHSTESFTHRKMTLSLADRSQKTSGIKILSQVGADPDQDRKELLKKEEEKLKQTFRNSKPRKKDTVPRIHANSSAYREDEGSEEEGAISLNAIKNKYKSGAAAMSKGGAIYSSDEEGSDIEARRNKKVDKTKALKDLDSSESE